MIQREATNTLLDLATGFYVVAITGPRQSGKTTLAQDVFPDKTYISLEDPDAREFAEEDPRRFLERLQNGAIIDEVQRCPKILSYLQTRVDADRQPGQFILTGSQQFDLRSGITQSLAGRVGLLHLLPFTLSEVRSAEKSPTSIDKLLHKGLYPPLYDRTVSPDTWYRNYMQTYVERDVRQLINVRDLSTFQRFLRMCAARTGQLLNLSSLANDCGISHNTAKSWVSVLEASYILFLLQPHHRNYNKRLVKTPKLYFYDSGFATWLLRIQSADQLAIHPSRGALFESWVVTELVKGRYNRGLESNLYFWRDNTGNEVDVIAEHANQLLPLEIKSGQTVTKDSFAGLLKWLSLADTNAHNPHLCFGGNESYIRYDISVLPWEKIGELAKTI